MYKELTCVIVDDDAIALSFVRLLLSKYKNVIIKGEASSRMSAIALIRKVKPDILITDIELGYNENIFQILSECKDCYGKVLFISNHLKYALEGYNFDSIHFLTKPVDQVKFDDAMDKLFRTIAKEKESTKTYDNYNYRLQNIGKDRIFLQDKNTYKSVEIESIIYIEAKGSYSLVFTHYGNMSVSKNLKQIAELLLDFKQFARVHKSYLVNINHIVVVNKKNSEIELINGTLLPVSLNERANLYSLLGNMNFIDFQLIT